MKWINDITSFWEQIKENEESIIKFEKKDGTIRNMRCTLDFDKIPKEKIPKGTGSTSPGIIKVYDLEKRGWRSVTFERVLWIKESKQNERFYIRR